MIELVKVNVDLVSVYAYPDYEKVAKFLYDMLGERDGAVNISHRRMPIYEDHLGFMRSKPYRAWFIIEHDGVMSGNIYITNKGEIGIFIKRSEQGKHLAKAAIQQLMSKFGKRRFLANINPNNKKSLELFKSLGFELLQVTYVLNQGGKQ